MEGVHLKIYVTEFSEYEGRLLYEWMVEKARDLGVPGCSVFRAIAGYGRHGKLHEETFFELAGDLPIEVGFVMTDRQAKDFLKLLEEHRLDLFYVLVKAEYGTVGRTIKT
ncbi:MAG: DUF190 domain-containing protein [Betaproteobacteria bacterium]|nr:DUF190 domain-containing protein [Betaproteobacteria bacterium]